MGAGRTLEETDSWRTVLFWMIFLFLSIVIEQVFHHVEHYLQHHSKKGILGAVHKIKEELMLMGFISLILLALEDQITWICVANQPLDWIESDSDWASGSPCCTLGNQYWENLPHATGGEHRRMEEVDFMREQAAEAWSPHRRLGAINLHTSLLRESCPSRKYVTDVDTFTHPIMPPVPHPFDCPANGKNHEGARVDDNPNGVVTASFMDPLALHHVHTLIFLTACWHVTYTMVVMVLSAWRIQHWAGWEYYGDDADEDVSKLTAPMVIDNKVYDVLVNLVAQFIKTVDPYTYIAIRRYYIVRNNMQWDFDFNTMCMQQQDRDFASLVGIEPWMWLMLVVQVILDGYTNNMWLKTSGTWIAVVLLMAVGTKLMLVFRKVVIEVADVYDDERDGSIDKADLDRLQGEKVDPNQLDHVNATFWFDKPEILLQILRAIMFQFSVNLAEVTFYSWQIGYGYSCYFMSRPIWWVVMIFVCLMVIQLGLITVPLYSLVSMTVHHNVHTKVELVKKFAVHKKIHIADITAIKTQMGLVKAEVVDKNKTPGWKIAAEQEKEKEMREKDPVKMAINDAKKGIAGTMQWVAHIQVLKSRITLTEAELSSALRLKEMSDEQKADAKANAEIKIQAARAEADKKKAAMIAEAKAEAQAASVAKNQVLPGGVPDVEAGTTLHHGSSKVELDQETGALIHKPVMQAVQEETTHEEHGEHGDEHGDEHGGGHSIRDSLVLGLNVFLLVAFCVALGTVTFWFGNVGMYPGVHWSYAGANGPAWWGTVKPKYHMCLDGKLQSPININVADGAGIIADTQYDGGTNIITSAPEQAPGKVLQFSLDADSSSDGAYFYPTQNHKSPRFDCGSQKSHASKGKCGYLTFDEQGSLHTSNLTKWNLQEFHFHAPAEHTINGKKYAMEMQVVFCTGNCDQDTDASGTVADSDSDPDKFAVYSVMFEAANASIGSNSSNALNTIWKYMRHDCPQTRDKYGYDCPSPGKYCDDVDATSCKKSVDKLRLKDLIHLGSSVTESGSHAGRFGAKDFYTYKGSITTPPCLEGVRWFLQKDIVTVPMDLIADFSKHIKGHPGNARPLQQRAGREITFFQ